MSWKRFGGDSFRGGVSGRGADLGKILGEMLHLKGVVFHLHL